jgi:hypothetical protein
MPTTCSPSDPHSGDYGLGFFGNALESGAYYVDDPTLGALCYLCDLTDAADDAEGGVHIVPRDAYGIAFFLEPLGLYMTSECGTFASADLPATAARPAAAAAAAAKAKASGEAMGTAQFAVALGGSAHCPYLRLKLTKTAQARPGSEFAVEGAQLVRGAWQIDVAPDAAGETSVTVTYTA